MDHFLELNSSSESITYLIENIKNFGIVKEISCVLNPIDFLFFEPEAKMNHYTFILQTYDDNILHLSQIKCGYTGEGPRAYQTILEFLGVSKEVAFQISQSSTSKVFFNSRGEFEKWIRPKSHITSRDESEKIGIQYTDIYLKHKILYLFNPERYLEELLVLLDEMNPYRLEYWIGEDSELDDSRRFKQTRMAQLNWEKNLGDYYETGSTALEKRSRKQLSYDRAKEVNIIFTGHDYDVLLLVPLSIQLSILEYIYLRFIGESFIEQNLSDVKKYLSKNDFSLSFTKNKVNHLHNVIRL